MAEYTSLQDTVYQPVAHQISTHGVAPDRPQEQLGDNYLASASNFVLRNGRVERRGGFSTLVDTDVTSSGARAFFEFTAVAGTAFLLAAGPFTIRYTTNGSSWTVISTGLAATGEYPVMFTYFLTSSGGPRIIAVHGGINPLSWTTSTATSFTTLSTAIASYALGAWRGHLLLGDTTVATGDGRVQARINWSALGNPATWSGTASAGFLDLMSINGTRVMCFQAMRTTLLVYKEEGVHALIYKASPFYFSQVEMHPAISIYNPRCVAPIGLGDTHFVFTKDGAIIWDGQSIRPIGRDKVDRTILNSIQGDAIARMWAAWSPLDNEILFALTTTGGVNPDTLWIYNLTYDAWWETDVPALCFGISRHVLPPLTLLTGVGTTPGGTGAASGQVFQLFTGLSDGTATAAITASIQTGLYDYDQFNHKDVYKTHVAFGPGTGLTSTIQLSKAGQENPVIASTFASAQSLTSTGGPGLPFVDYRLTNRWIAYRVTHTAANELCQISAILPELTPRTVRRKD